MVSARLLVRWRSLGSWTCEPQCVPLRSVRGGWGAGRCPALSLACTIARYMRHCRPSVRWPTASSVGTRHVSVDAVQCLCCQLGGEGHSTLPSSYPVPPSAGICFAGCSSVGERGRGSVAGGSSSQAMSSLWASGGGRVGALEWTQCLGLEKTELPPRGASVFRRR